MCETAAATEVATEGEGGKQDLKTKEELEALEVQQLSAVKVLYAAQVLFLFIHTKKKTDDVAIAHVWFGVFCLTPQHAVKLANESCGAAPCGLDPRPEFDQLMKNVTFPTTTLGGTFVRCATCTGICRKSSREHTHAYPHSTHALRSIRSE